MRVIPIPCLKDNFAYLVGSEDSRSVVVVDPSEAAPVLSALEKQDLTLVGILCTHHHRDHVGGNLGLLEELGQLPVYAHESDRGRVPGQTHGLNEGDQLGAAGIDFNVLFIPGHTQGQIAYLADDVVFVGDTLFGAGCGRLREGSAEQLYASLQRLGRLPAETRVYFGHEYTEANLRFARVIEPNNRDIQTRQAWAIAERKAGRFTTPSTVAEEQRTNPFLRVSEPSVAAHFAAQLGGNTDPVSVFAAARSAKDTFQG